MSAKYPRPIKPELIEIGDDIEITLPPVDGMALTRRGKITGITSHGNVRNLIVGSSTVLGVWAPGERLRGSIIIHSRKPVEQTSLPMFSEAMDAVRERIA